MRWPQTSNRLDFGRSFLVALREKYARPAADTSGEAVADEGEANMQLKESTAPANPATFGDTNIPVNMYGFDKVAAKQRCVDYCPTLDTIAHVYC